MKKEFQPTIKPLRMWSEKLQADLHVKNEQLTVLYTTNTKVTKTTSAAKGATTTSATAAKPGDKTV